MLLTNMLDAQNDGERWGRRLTERDVEEHLRAQQVARDDYERSHPDDVAELKTLVAPTASR